MDNEEPIFTEPIKVISKADNIIKKPKDELNNKKKRTASDAFGDTLQRIEQQQSEQKTLIDKLVEQNQLLMAQIQQPNSPFSSFGSPASSSSFGSPSSVMSSPSSPYYQQASLSTDYKWMQFESSLRNFINCYENIAPNDRPNKIRIIQRVLSSSDLDTVTGFAKEVLASSALSSSPSPAEDLFDSFLSSSTSTPSSSSDFASSEDEMNFTNSLLENEIFNAEFNEAFNNANGSLSNFIC